MLWRRNLLLSMMLSLASFTNLFAVDCNTDCNHQCQVCVHTPWGKKCVTEPGCWSTCEPTKRTACDALEAARRTVENQAFKMALDAKTLRAINDQEDCITFVSVGLVVWGTAQGGYIGSFVGAGGALAFSRMACRRAFPIPGA